MGWEESPLSSTTSHFFPPKEKTVNVKKEKERNFDGFLFFTNVTPNSDWNPLSERQPI
jgi:hypothetical protein